MDDDQRISLGWTAAIAARDCEIVTIAREVPSFSRSAIGLVSPTVDAGLREDSLPFGVILYAEGITAHAVDEEWRASITFPESNVEFPVVIRRGIFTPTSGPTQVGSNACWATWRKGKSRGWLTARHVARAIPSGQVVDVASDCVDAALIDVQPHPTNPVPDSISTTAPRAQLPVQLNFKTRTTTVILDVSSTLGVNDQSFHCASALRRQASPVIRAASSPRQYGVAHGIARWASGRSCTWPWPRSSATALNREGREWLEVAGRKFSSTSPTSEL